MTEIHVVFEDQTLRQLQERATERGFPSPESYVQNLVENDLRLDVDGPADPRLEQLLLKRLDSPRIALTDDVKRLFDARIAKALRQDER